MKIEVFHASRGRLTINAICQTLRVTTFSVNEQYTELVNQSQTVYFLPYHDIKISRPCQNKSSFSLAAPIKPNISYRSPKQEVFIFLGPRQSDVQSSIREWPLSTPDFCLAGSCAKIIQNKRELIYVWWQ